MREGGDKLRNTCTRNLFKPANSAVDKCLWERKIVCTVSLNEEIRFQNRTCLYDLIFATPTPLAKGGRRCREASHGDLAGRLGTDSPCDADLRKLCISCSKCRGDVLREAHTLGQTQAGRAGTLASQFFSLPKGDLLGSRRP